jgi:hypothetical protein
MRSKFPGNFVGVICKHSSVISLTETCVYIYIYTVDSRYLEFDGTMEKIRVNRSSTQEELRRYRKRGLFNNERETSIAQRKIRHDG